MPGRALSCLCLEVQVVVCSFLPLAPRLCIILPADAVCGQQAGNLGLENVGAGEKDKHQGPEDGDMSWATENGTLGSNGLVANTWQCTVLSRAG